MFRRTRTEPDSRWWRLATYNAEVARGIRVNQTARRALAEDTEEAA